MSDMSVDQILSQMQQMRGQAVQRIGAEENQVAPVNQNPGVEKASFQDALTNAVGQVNELQLESNALRSRYEAGDDEVSLTEVMLASQKSSLGFNATLQVRNRLVQAYQDIMNMPL